MLEMSARASEVREERLVKIKEEERKEFTRGILGEFTRFPL